jgi:hypothetical protein
MTLPFIPLSCERGERAVRARQRGLSMLELCIAIVIAAFVLFCVFELIATGMRSQAQSRISATLTSLAQKALEKTRLDVYDSGIAGSILTDSPANGIRFQSPNDMFFYRVTYYQYEQVDYPQLTILFLSSSSHPERAMYIVAVQIVVNGPLKPDGITKLNGYRSMQVLTLMQYPGYRSSTPPASNPMPPGLIAVPAPAASIGMPARGVAPP